MLKVEKGNQVKVHYRGVLTDGTEFDNSYMCGDPIEFVAGSGQMVRGFDSAVVGMTIGDKKTVKLTAEDAYGPINPEATTKIPRAAFPQEVELTEGLPVPLSTPEGHRLVGTIRELDESVVTVDLNHPLAGQELQFDIELVSIEEANSESNEDA